MILHSVLSRGCSQIQKRKMATRLRCSRASAAAIMGLFNTKLEKTAAATRPRSNQANHYHLHLRQKKHLGTCLNLIFIILLFRTAFVFLDAGRYLKHQPAVQESNLSFVFRLGDEPHFSEQTGSQYSESSKLLLLFFLALFIWVTSRTITGLAGGLSGDQRLPKSPIVHHSERFGTPDREYLHRITVPKAIISCLSYLALGLLAALLLRSSGVHPKESDFCLAGAQHIHQLYQDYKKINFRIFATILIAPVSSNQTTLERKIVNPFHRFKIRAFLEMDPANPKPRSVYRPIKHRVSDAEVLTLQYLESETGENAGFLRKGGEDNYSDVLTRSGRPAIIWAPDPEHRPSDRSSQVKMKAKNQAEGGGAATLTENFYLGVPPSNTTSPIGTPARAVYSNYLEPTESFSSPSSGPIRTALRKTKGSIFRHASSQADAEIAPMPQQGLFSRATGSILRGHSRQREESHLVANRSIGNGQSTISQGPTNPRRVRNMAFEEQARTMGFDVSQNRFGLREEIVDGAFPIQSRQRISSDSGTMVGQETSDDDYDFADDEITVLGDAETVQGGYGLRSPPTAAKFPVTETEGGLDYLQDSPSDYISWLTDCFTSPDIDLLKDFGTPPKVSTHSSHSSPWFKMADEACEGLYNHGASHMIGDFDKYEAEQVKNPFLDHSQEEQDNAEQVQNSGPGHSQQELDNSSEVNKLRGQIRTLVEKFIAMAKAKDSELQNVKACEAAAVERVKVLEKILELYGIAYGNAEELFEDDNGFDLGTNTFGAQYTPTKPGSTSTSKGSLGEDSGGKRSSHKKSKSQEGSFFKSLLGTTEPSKVAFEKLKERSLLEANTDEKDPDLAVKLGVSSRQLPPEAPKPASKDPVPKVKNGTISKLRRLSSRDNLKRKDGKVPGSSESKNYSTRNASQSSYTSRSKETSRTSITEESTGASKSPEITGGPPSYRDRVASFSEDSSPPANHQRHSRSSGKELTGQYDPDLSLALAALTADRSQQRGSGAIPQGWECMGVSRDSRKGECDEQGSMKGECERPTGVQDVSHGAHNSSVGALVHEKQAFLNEDRADQVLRPNPPSRSPPARPGLLDDSSEVHEQYFEIQEAHGEQRGQAKAPRTPEKFNLNKSLSDINLEEAEIEEGKKDGKKRGLKNLFTRK
jgi:hypothetical protein